MAALESAISVLIQAARSIYSSPTNANHVAVRPARDHGGRTRTRLERLDPPDPGETRCLFGHLQPLQDLLDRIGQEAYFSLDDDALRAVEG